MTLLTTPEFISMEISTTSGIESATGIPSIKISGPGVI
jgi:hypothetical protein